MKTGRMTLLLSPEGFCIGESCRTENRPEGFHYERPQDSRPEDHCT
jgi:hypothetical protein